MNKENIELEICRSETAIAQEIYRLEKLTEKKLKSFDVLNRDFTLENGKETEGFKPLIELK